MTNVKFLTGLYQQSGSTAKDKFWSSEIHTLTTGWAKTDVD